MTNSTTLIGTNRTCQYCGDPFDDPSRSQTKKFCSENCRKREWENTRYFKDCPDCGRNRIRKDKVRCVDCVRDASLPVREAKLRRIADLWNSGLSAEEVGREAGYTTGSVQQMIYLARRLGIHCERRGATSPDAGRPRSSNPTKDQVRRRTRAALQRGDLIRPDACERCKNERHVDAHHRSYDKPDSHLDVEWLCPTCHNAEHYAAA